MRDFRDDFEDDLEQFARALRWTDAVSLAVTIPLLAMLLWWMMRS